MRRSARQSQPRSPARSRMPPQGQQRPTRPSSYAVPPHVADTGQASDRQLHAWRSRVERPGA